MSTNIRHCVTRCGQHQQQHGQEGLGRANLCVRASQYHLVPRASQLQQVQRPWTAPTHQNLCSLPPAWPPACLLLQAGWDVLVARWPMLALWFPPWSCTLAASLLAALGAELAARGQRPVVFWSFSGAAKVGAAVAACGPGERGLGLVGFGWFAGGDCTHSPGGGGVLGSKGTAML